MKKIYSFLCLLFFLAACSMPAAEKPADVNQSASEVLTLPTTQPTFTPIVPLAPTSTLEIPSPTQLAAVIPTLTPLPPPQTGASNEIKFPPGGTSIDFEDSAPSGESKTYLLTAMQGQVMSVSVLPLSGEGWAYFPLQIQGRDGTVLCPVGQNSDCAFWRGTLPLSQDYFITVTPQGDQTKFMLHVAINPLGKAEQIFKYNGPANAFSISYSDQFAWASFPAVLNNRTDLKFALRFIDTASYINTNLGEAYFVFGSAPGAAACSQPKQNEMPEVSGGNVTVNKYTFAYSTISDAGAGNIYNQYIYRLVNGGVCYEAIYFIHSSNIGNFPPGVVKEFDLNGLLQKLNGILSTLELK